MSFLNWYAEHPFLGTLILLILASTLITLIEEFGRRT